MRLHPHPNSANPTHQPLLDRAELAALIDQGERLARHTPTAGSDTGRHGGAAARRLGEGLDFAEHRRYQPGDDPRRINWRLTARHGDPHVRRYHEDVTAPCVLLVDRRAPMRFATRGHLKAAQAVRVAMVLAGLYAARQASVTVAELDSRLHLHAPTNRTGLLPLGQHLAAPCPPTETAGMTLDQALVTLDAQLPPGARLLLLSDFADAATVTPTHWHRLARRYRIDGVLVEDPAEVSLPTTTARHGARLSWHRDDDLPLDQTLSQRLATAHQQRLDILRKALTAAGIGLHRIDTRQDDVTAVVRSLAG
jgi:uncharacterized protein (DUF58 family)